MNNIFIINGMAGVGKDSFVNALNQIIPTLHVSIVGQVKQLAEEIGWDGKKDEKGRKLLCDLKKITDEYDDRNFKYIEKIVKNFKKGVYKHKVLCIDMREPKDIERAKREFGAMTVLIKRSVNNITSNYADACTLDSNIYYDVEIDNNGSLDDLKKIAKEFKNKVIFGKNIKENKGTNQQKVNINISLFDLINWLFN